MLQSLAAMPAAAAAAPPAPLPPAAAAAAAAQQASAASEEFPKLTLTSIERSSAAAMPGFFSKPQMEALTRLCDAIVPASAVGRPAASEAGVPEFLDFLVSQSDGAAKDSYRAGLDRLAREGVNDKTLAPLGEAWSYTGPADPFAQFLRRAKGDIIQAAMNSRAWAESLGRGRRGSAPGGYYWRSLD